MYALQHPFQFWMCLGNPCSVTRSEEKRLNLRARTYIHCRGRFVDGSALTWQEWTFLCARKFSNNQGSSIEADPSIEGSAKSKEEGATYVRIRMSWYCQGSLPEKSVTVIHEVAGRTKMYSRSSLIFPDEPECLSLE